MSIISYEDESHPDIIGDMTVRTRIAPSPTGMLHLGTAYTAMRNLALAHQKGGQFLIRIEDTDRTRLVDGAVDVIFEALGWLGISNDEGPNVGGPHAPYVQSERLDTYQKYAKELVEKGQAYYCFCTKERLDEVRQKQLAAKELPRYDRHCRDLDKTQVAKELGNMTPYVIRLKVPVSGVTICHDAIRGDVEFQNAGIDDQVLLKSDGYPTYHLGVVVDDYLMGITHIVRGEEWLSSSPKHILLYQAFGWPAPVFAHLPVIRNRDKSKMSKRKNDVSVLSYRTKGYLPDALMNYLALMGWSHPEGKDIFSLDEFIKLFTLERVTLTAPVFDIDKLNWFNGQYIRMKSDEELLALLKPFIPDGASEERVRQIIPLIKPRINVLTDFTAMAGFYFVEPTVPELVPQDKEYLAVAKDVLTNADWTKEGIEAELVENVKNKGWKNGPFFAALRLTITGSKVSPPLTESMLILGREVVLNRLNKLV